METKKKKRASFEKKMGKFCEGKKTVCGKGGNHLEGGGGLNLKRGGKVPSSIVEG